MGRKPRTLESEKSVGEVLWNEEQAVKGVMSYGV